MKSAMNILSAILIATPALAQVPVVIDSELGMRFGASLGAALNFHTASFRALPGVPNCCPEYEGGLGIGVVGSLLLELPLSKSLSLESRATFATLSALLSRTEETTVESGGVAVPASFDHRLDASLATAAVELRAGWMPSSRLMLAAGMRGGVRTAGTFEQIEQLSDNVEHGSFENGRRTRNEFTGDIPDANSLELSLLAAVSFELPLSSNGTLTARPELTLTFGLSPVSNAVSWNAHQLQLGVAFLYAKPVPPPPPVVITPPPRLNVAVDIVPADNAVWEKDRPSIQVRELTDRWYSPLVPAVFFDSGAVQLATRYHSLSSVQARAFSIDSMTVGEFVDDHRHVLNVTGYRLRRDSTLRVTLTGSTMSGETRDVARKRSEAVRDYLVSAWGIAPNQIKLSDVGDPFPRANEATEDGRHENRHVAIVPSAPAIVAPVYSARTSYRYEPAAIELRPIITSDRGVRDLDIAITREGKPVEQFNDVADMDSLRPTIRWSVSSSGIVPDSNGVPLAIDVDIDVENDLGTHARASTTLPFVLQRDVRWLDGSFERVGRLERSTYQLVAFELDSPEPGVINRSVLRDIVDAMRPGATITIRGYSDRMGTLERNTELAAQRSAAVARIITEIMPADIATKVIIDAKGEGVDQLRFTNELPEGRVLSRGVSIVVEQVSQSE